MSLPKSPFQLCPASPSPPPVGICRVPSVSLCEKKSWCVSYSDLQGFILLTVEIGRLSGWVLTDMPGSLARSLGQCPRQHRRDILRTCLVGDWCSHGSPQWQSQRPDNACCFCISTCQGRSLGSQTHPCMWWSSPRLITPQHQLFFLNMEALSDTQLFKC